MSPELCRGVIYGFILAGIIGFLLNRIREGRASAKRMRQPLDTFPDAFQPRMTPIGIVLKGLIGILACSFWLFVLLVVLGIASCYICLNCEELPEIAQYLCDLMDFCQHIPFQLMIP